MTPKTPASSIPWTEVRHEPPYLSSTLRQRVAETFGHCCAYCRTAQRIVGPLLEIDHITPQSKGGSSEEENLALACPVCNSHKSDLIEAPDPGSGKISLLFNPRTQVWAEHFVWLDGGATIAGMTACGRATVTALHVNDPDVVAARRLWIAVGWHPPIEKS